LSILYSDAMKVLLQFQLTHQENELCDKRLIDPSRVRDLFGQIPGLSSPPESNRYCNNHCCIHSNAIVPCFVAKPSQALFSPPFWWLQDCPDYQSDKSQYNQDDKRLDNFFDFHSSAPSDLSNFLNTIQLFRNG
jgi:hypothetical protein